MRISTGRCFIFVMKYIKLTYIQAGIIAYFFSCVCLLFNPLVKIQRCVQEIEEGITVSMGRTWQP